MMPTITLKLPEGVKQKLNFLARRRGVSRSEVIRSALMEYFEKDEVKREGTFYDLARDLAGGVEEVPDLSANKKYLSGYGQ